MMNNQFSITNDWNDKRIEIQMYRAYGSQWFCGVNLYGRNKFHPYKMKRAYGSNL